MLKKSILFFQITRPILWLPIITVFLLGVWMGGGANCFATIYFIYAFLGIILISSFCYSINYISDTKIDKFAGKYLQIFDEININIILIYSVILALSGLFFFSLISHLSLYLAITIVLFGILYSVKPFRFKSKAPLDVFSHIIGLGFFPFLVGWTCMGDISTTSLYYATSIGIFIGFGYMLLTISDSEFDKKLNINTIVVKIGNRNSMILSFILLFISLSFYFKINNSFFFTYLLCLPSAVIYNFPRMYSKYILPRVLLNLTMFFWCEIILLILLIYSKSIIILSYILFSIILIYYRKI